MLNLLLILPLLAQATPQDPPQLFRDLSLDEALAAASKERKMVLLDAMTSWCSPCRQMDLTTWRDPELVPWLSERAVCIKLDMDEHGDIRRRLEVRGYPTLIAFRGGVTFDRVLGYKSAAQIRSWIEGLEEGKTDVRRLLERVEAFRDMRIEDVGFEDRRSVAEGLLEHGEDETAGAEFLWLWDNIPHHAPNLAAWRWDVLPGELGLLDHHGVACGKEHLVPDRTQGFVSIVDPVPWEGHELVGGDFGALLGPVRGQVGFEDVGHEAFGVDGLAGGHHVPNL